MNLTIDIGNSFLKLGVFDGDNKIFVTRIADLTIDFLTELISKYRIDRMIYSSVKEGDKSYISVFEKTGIKIHRLDSSSKLPFEILYLTPESLGTDRIAGIASAHNKFESRNVMVIDAGTAVTYDILTSDDIYLGGNISPGLSMRFKALNTYTASLPMVNADYKYDILGKDTDGAIRAGVQQGLIFEINEYIRNFKKRYKDLEVVLTGGDGKYLSESVDFPVTFAPDLIIEGLNYILDYNA